MELDTNQADNSAAEVQDAPEAAEQQGQPKEHHQQAKGKKKKQEHAKHDADEDKDGSSPQKKQPLLHVTVVEGKRERKKVRDRRCCMLCLCNSRAAS
jgi:hypothetical protein